MAVNPSQTSLYAVQIFLLGTRRFTARLDSTGTKMIAGIPAEYHQPVKVYAATTPDVIYLSDIVYARDVGWINQQEYDDIIALMPPGAP